MARFTIRKKILLGFIVGTAVPIVLLVLFDIRTARNELEMQQIQALDAIADLKQQRIETFFEHIAEDTIFMSHLDIITKPFPIINELYTDREDPAYQEARRELDNHLIQSRQQKNFLEIIFADQNGHMVYNTGAVHNDSELGMSVEMLIAKDYFLTNNEHVFVSDIFSSPFSPSGFEMISAAPIYSHSDGHDHHDREYLGMVILAIDMGPVFDLILDTKGLGETGETLIGRNEGDHALFINPLRYDADAALTRKVPYTSADAMPIRQATQGQKGSGITTDYRSESVIAAWRPLELPSDDLTWGVVAKIDTREAFASSQDLLYQALLIGGGALVLLILAAQYLSRSIIRPLYDVRNAAGRIAEGSLDVRVKYKGDDEIGDLGMSFNHMTDQLVQIRSRLADQNEKLESNVGLLEKNNTEIERSKRATLNILEDVQEEKEKNRQEKERIATILHSIGDGVFVVDINHVIQSINPIAVDLCGYSAEEAIGKPYKEIFNFVFEKDDTVNDKFVIDAIATGEIQEMANHTLLIKRDGTKIPVADSAAPLKDKDGQVRGCVVVFRDVSKEHAIDKAKTEFVSLASHQLRTPLSAINWNVEMLRDEIRETLDEEQKQYLDDVYASSVRMSELVSALLNVSRLELGTFTVEPESTDIITLAQDVVKDLQPKIDAKQLQIIQKYNPQSIVMNVDPKLMRMVIENLLSNAVKYTPDEKPITVHIEQREKDVLLEVADQGYGIPKAQQSKVFTRLFRADNVRSKDVEGTGLGLYLVKSIVEHAHGTIEFESQENLGTTFSVTIPLEGMAKKEGTRTLA